MTHWHSISTTYQDHGITASRLTKFDTLNIGTTDFTLFALRVEYHSRSHQIEKIITLSSFNIMRISIILGDCLISDPCIINTLIDRLEVVRLLGILACKNSNFSQ